MKRFLTPGLGIVVAAALAMTAGCSGQPEKSSHALQRQTVGGGHEHGQDHRGQDYRS